VIRWKRRECRGRSPALQVDGAPASQPAGEQEPELLDELAPTLFDHVEVFGRLARRLDPHDRPRGCLGSEGDRVVLAQDDLVRRRRPGAVNEDQLDLVVDAGVVPAEPLPDQRGLDEMPPDRRGRRVHCGFYLERIHGSSPYA
jgi:hypothetical protein